MNRRVEIDTREVRRIILRQSRRANVGHIGSCLCVVEILAALYSGILRIERPDDANRDRFIFSKGHAGLALYATLALAGWLTPDDLDTFCGEGSALGVHPEPITAGVDFATGSLGHGLSVAAGAALAARMQFSARQIYCLISDAEFNEGSTWEAAMFAAHHGLANLTVIADMNGQQAFGRTQDVIAVPNPRERWEAFGWQASEVDGHSVHALQAAMRAQSGNAPHILLARTTFGKGVRYMQSGEAISQTHLATQAINWHYLPMSAEEFRMALDEVDAS